MIKEVLFKKAAKQIVYGVVSEPDSVDDEGDVMSAETIEEAAHAFLQKHRLLSDSHQRDAKGTLIQADAEIVESFVAPTDYEVAGETIKKGSWVMAVKINSPELWYAVSSGEYDAFSIGGTGYRTPIVDDE